MCYARFAYFMLYVLCINVPCMMSIAPIRVDLPTLQTNSKQNKLITGRCHEPSFLLSIWLATLFIRPYWNVLGESSRSYVVLQTFHCIWKDYRQLLKLEVLMGRGRGKRKVELVVPPCCLSIMEDSYSNHSNCFNLNCDTWLIDILAWKQMYFLKKSVQ